MKKNINSGMDLFEELAEYQEAASNMANSNLPS